MTFSAVFLLQGSRLPMTGLVFGAAAFVTAAGFAPARSEETVLYSFEGGFDGGIPYSGLLADEHGALYGATDVGGTTGVCDGNNGGCGTIFKLTPPAEGQTAWTKNVIYNFKGAGDGANPQTRLIAGEDGALYGTTSGGGQSFMGTVFKLTPPAEGQTEWTETVLHSFGASVDDGRYPSRVIADKQAALYGTTEFGGRHNMGTVFELTPPPKGQTDWQETVLHSFTGGRDGAEPLADMIFDEQGALYGTTRLGGSNCNIGCGTVFKLTPPPTDQANWTEAVLYRFKGGSDGGFPNAGLIADKQGALYGSTTQGGIDACKPQDGCGTVFKLTPAKDQTNWTEAVLYRFKGGSDGGFPNADLIADKQGALYGSTGTGGSAGGIGDSSANGIVFKLAPPAKGQSVWTETVLYSFKGGMDGAFPSGLLMHHHGALLGAASRGGNSACDGFGCGTVFEITLSH